MTAVDPKDLKQGQTVRVEFEGTIHEEWSGCDGGCVRVATKDGRIHTFSVTGDDASFEVIAPPLPTGTGAWIVAKLGTGQTAAPVTLTHQGAGQWLEPVSGNTYYRGAITEWALLDGVHTAPTSEPEAKPDLAFPIGSHIIATCSKESLTGDRIMKGCTYEVTDVDHGGWPILHTDKHGGGGWAPTQFRPRPEDLPTEFGAMVSATVSANGDVVGRDVVLVHAPTGDRDAYPWLSERCIDGSRWWAPDQLSDVVVINAGVSS